MVWMSYQQAKNGPLTLFTDVMYASVANSDLFLISKTFSPHVSGTIGAALSADYQYWIVEGGATYEVASWHSHGGRYASPCHPRARSEDPARPRVSRSTTRSAPIAPGILGIKPRMTPRGAPPASPLPLEEARVRGNAWSRPR